MTLYFKIEFLPEDSDLHQVTISGLRIGHDMMNLMLLIISKFSLKVDNDTIIFEPITDA